MSSKSVFRLALLKRHLQTKVKDYSRVGGSHSNKVKVNGVNFHFERAGNGEHTVLLLPGSLGCSQTDFKPQIEGLSRDKYTVIAFDPRGYGYSRPPDRTWPLLHLQRDAEDAAAMMQTLGFSKYSVLGWSDGGITGLVLAAAFPECVRKLLIWGTYSYLSDKYTDQYDAVDDFSKWSEDVLAPYIAVYGEKYFAAQWKNWLQAIKNYYTKRKGNICVDSLPNVACKTLIINGLKDPLVPQEHPRFLQQNIKRCRTIDWPLGKHNLHLRFPKEFNETAEQFLDETDSWA